MAHQTVCIILAEGDRERLKAIVGDRNRPLKHVQRAQIVLASDRQPRVLKVAEAVGNAHGAIRAPVRSVTPSCSLVSKAIGRTSQRSGTMSISRGWSLMCSTLTNCG